MTKLATEERVEHTPPAINTRRMARDLSAWVFSSALAWSVIWALAVGVKLAWVLIH